MAGAGVVGQRVEDQRIAHLGHAVDVFSGDAWILPSASPDRAGFDDLFAGLAIDDRARRVVSGLQLADLDRLDRVKFLAPQNPKTPFYYFMKY